MRLKIVGIGYSESTVHMETKSNNFNMRCVYLHQTLIRIAADDLSKFPKVTAEEGVGLPAVSKVNIATLSTLVLSPSI